MLLPLYVSGITIVCHGSSNNTQFEKSSKSAVQERKIRVNWLSQDLDASQGGDTNGTVRFLFSQRFCFPSWTR